MKKLLFILLFIVFIPVFAFAETCDNDQISISSITMEDKSDDVNEVEKATSNGKNINLNLSMSSLGDSIKYKLIVKNDSSEDYEIDKNSFNIDSTYFDYTLLDNEDSNVVKANSSKEMYLKVEYKKEVPADVFKSGTYNDNKTMTINLSSENKSNIINILKNPTTGISPYIIIILLLIIVSLTTYAIKKKESILFILIISFSILIPISISALCKCNINIKSNIKVNYLNSYFYVCDQHDYYMPYRKGMTWVEFDDYIVENYKYYKTYYMNDQGNFVELFPLKKYGMDKNRHVLDRIGDPYNPEFEYAEYILPEFDNSPEILHDDFFAYGKSKEIGRYYDYSYPNVFNPIKNLDTLYPDFYKEVSKDPDWTFWNDNIFDYKYGCYYFDGS